MLAFNENTIKVWDLRKTAVIETISPSSSINNVSFDFSGSLISISLEKDVGLNFVKQGKTVYLKKDKSLIDDISEFSFDKEVLNSISTDGCLGFRVLSNNKSILTTKKGKVYYN